MPEGWAEELSFQVLNGNFLVFQSLVLVDGDTEFHTRSYDILACSIHEICAAPEDSLKHRHSGFP